MKKFLPVCLFLIIVFGCSDNDNLLSEVTSQPQEADLEFDMLSENMAEETVALDELKESIELRQKVSSYSAAEYEYLNSVDPEIPAEEATKILQSRRDENTVSFRTKNGIFSYLLGQRYSYSGSRIVRIAFGELGKTSSEVGNRSDFSMVSGMKNPDDAWCSEFVSWVYAIEGTFPFTGGSGGATPAYMKTSAKRIKTWFESNSCWVDRNNAEWDDVKPSPGDYVMFSSPGSTYQHSAIVVGVYGSLLITIDGNSSDKVQLRVRKNYKSKSKNSNFWVQGFGLRHGMDESLKVDKNDAIASSSGTQRYSKYAFDNNSKTFWRNRTKNGYGQYVGIKFDDYETIYGVKLKYGSHYPSRLKVKFYRDSELVGTYTYNYNSNTSDNFKFEFGYAKVNKVLVECTKYRKDDYFSVYEIDFTK